MASTPKSGDDKGDEDGGEFSGSNPKIYKSVRVGGSGELCLL